MKKWASSQHQKKKSLCWIYNAAYNVGMIKLIQTTLFGFSLLLAGAVNAVDSASNNALENEASGPEIRIFADKGQMIEEYRSNGQLYMIKITPKKGRPYYLVDADGDGEMDVRKNDLSPNLKIPSWVIFSW